MLLARSSRSSCATSSPSSGTLSLSVTGNEKSGLEGPCDTGEAFKSPFSSFGVFVSGSGVTPVASRASLPARTASGELDVGCADEH
eukprot:5074838-Pyramimonas_sp.AAC.1